MDSIRGIYNYLAGTSPIETKQADQADTENANSVESKKIEQVAENIIYHNDEGYKSSEDYYSQSESESIGDDEFFGELKEMNPSLEKFIESDVKSDLEQANLEETNKKEHHHNSFDATSAKDEVRHDEILQRKEQESESGEETDEELRYEQSLKKVQDHVESDEESSDQSREPRQSGKRLEMKSISEEKKLLNSGVQSKEQSNNQLKAIPKVAQKPLKAIVIDPNIQELQKEALKIGFPNLGSIAGRVGNIASAAKGLWTFLNTPNATYKPSEVMGEAVLQREIENKKDEVIDFSINAEKKLQSLPLLKNIKLFDKSDSFLVKGVKAIVNFVRGIFYKIGVFFGICKAMSKIDFKLVADKAELKGKLESRQDLLKKGYDLYTKREIVRIESYSLRMHLNKTNKHVKRIAALEYEKQILTDKIDLLEKSKEFKELNLEMQRVADDKNYDLLKEFEKSSEVIRQRVHESNKHLPIKDFESVYADSFYLFKDPLTKQYRRDVHELNRKAKVEELDEELKLEHKNLAHVHLEKGSQIESDATIINKNKALEQVSTDYMAQVQELKNTYKQTLDEINLQAEKENTNDLIRDFVDVTLYEIPIIKVLSKIFPTTLSTASHIVSAGLINHSLGFLRDNLLGEENQNRIKDVLDNVQDKVVKDLTKNLKVINTVYYENPKKKDVSPSDYNLSIQSLVLDKLRTGETNEQKKAFLGKAVPDLSPNQRKLLPKKEKLLQKSTPLIEEKIKKEGDVAEALIQKIHNQYQPKIDLIENQVNSDNALLLNVFQNRVKLLAKRKDIDQDQKAENYDKIEASYNSGHARLKTLNEMRSNELRNLKRNEELDIEAVKVGLQQSIEKLKATQTIDKAITAREAHIKTVNVARDPTKPMKNTKIDQQIEKDKAGIAKLKTLKEAEVKIADGEAMVYESIATLVQDAILFPKGIPSDLKKLLSATGQTELIKDIIKNQLILVVKYLDDPATLKNKINELLVESLKLEQNQELAGNIKALLLPMLGKIADLALDYTGATDLIVNRIDASRVNKYLFFSSLYSTAEGAVAAAGKTMNVVDGKITISG